MELYELLKEAVQKEQSDLFMVAGIPLSFKEKGIIKAYNAEKLMPTETRQYITTLYELAKRDMTRLIEGGDDDFSFSLQHVGRFRVNTYKQRGSLAAVIRVVKFDLPNPKLLGITENVLKVANRKKGLVLVTGPSGSGKSTTLSCMIDAINQDRNCHVITLEDPIEYIHKHKNSIVSQREIPSDTESYTTGLRAALRESPEVILLGEMRDLETIQIAMTAAETGQLIFSTLHTMGAAHTIDRIIDVYPPNQQQQIRLQLAMVLQSVITQQLVPTIEGGLVPVFEVMHVTPAISNMIREGKMHQISAMLYSSTDEGMCTMDQSLLDLYKEKKITYETAIRYSINTEWIQKKIKG